MPEKGERQLSDPYATKTQGINVFDARVVAQIHKNADTDVNRTSIHHTLGPDANQAAPGNHTHDGSTSPQIGIGKTITGSKGGNIALASLLAALVDILGITDNTT